MKLIDKGNGRNYYLVEDGKYTDVIKVKGNYYKTKFSEIFRELVAVGNPLIIKGIK